LKKYPDQIKNSEVQRQQMQAFFDKMKGRRSINTDDKNDDSE